MSDLTSNDVMDQIHASAQGGAGATPTYRTSGDVINHIHANGGQLPGAQDSTAAIDRMNQQFAQVAGHVRANNAAIDEAQARDAEAQAHPIANAANAFYQNAGLGLANLRARAGAYFSHNIQTTPMDEKLQEGANGAITNTGLQDVNTKVRTDINANRAQAQKLFPYSQNAPGASTAAMAGGMAPVLAYPPAAGLTMPALGYEGRAEEIDALRQAGQDISPGREVAYQAGGTAIDALMGNLSPGTRAGGALTNTITPLVKNAGAQTALKIGMGATVGVNEMEAFRAAQKANQIAQGIGSPEEQAKSNYERMTEGSGEGSVPGALLGGVGAAMHTFGSRPIPKGDLGAPRPAEAPVPATAAPSATPELRGSVAGYADRLAQATDPNNPQNAFKRAAAMQAAKGGASESIPDPAVLEKGNHGFEDAEGRPADPNPVEVKTAEVETPQRRAADHEFADAVFQSPEQAAPNTIHALDRYQPKPYQPPETQGPSPAQNVRPPPVEAKAATAESKGPTVFQTSAGEKAVAEEYGKPAETPKAVEALKVAEPTPALLPPEAKTPEATPAATPEAAPEGETFFQKLVREGAAQAKRLASEEEGGTSAATVFAQKTVIPTARAAADAFVGAARGLRRMFGGQSGTPAEATKEIFKERGGKLARYADQVNDQLDNMEKAVNRLPVDQQRAITDNAELGQPQPDKNFQQAADTMQVMYKDQLAEMQARDPRFQGIENYMGHMYENADPQKTATLISEHMSQRPLAGKGDFKNERIFPLQADAVKAGLEPVNNPVTVAKAKLKAMAQWIHTFDAKAHMDAAGMLKDVPENGKIPEGMATVSDPMFRGKMMPEEAASVLQNATSRGIMGDPNFGPVLRGLRTAANMVNQSSLGLSAFHATGSAINSAVSEFALGLEHLAPAVGFKGTFRPVEGLTKLANGTTMLGPAIRDYMLGKKGQAEWLKPGSTDPQTKLLMDAMEGEGGRALTTADYQTQATEKMMKAFREGNPLAGILRAPLAGLEQLAKPIMEKLVPRLKIGAYMQMGRQALLDHPNATAEELPGLMNKAWESVDNRFGQLVHDNRFWNQTTKQIAQMSMRSLGWNLGSLHEATGAAVDTAKALKDAVSGTQPQLTHKMSYAAALPTLVGIAGAVIHCGLHGTAPTNLADLYHVPTGEKDADGHDVKINLPTYMKDVASVGHDPMGTVANKLHPLIGSTVELMRNKDYYGNKVYQEDDTAVQAMKDVAKHYGEAAVPLSIRQLMQAHEEEQSAGSQIARFAGVTQSPKYLSQSAAEQAALAPVQARSQAQEGRTTAAQLKNDLTSAVRNKAPDAQERIDAAVKAGDITAQDVPKIRQNATKPHNLTTALGNPAVSADYMMTHVLPKMTQEEARTNQMVMIRRLNAADITPAKKQQYRAALSAAVKGQ